jgi:hypothetical protein
MQDFIREKSILKKQARIITFKHLRAQAKNENNT